MKENIGFENPTDILKQTEVGKNFVESAELMFKNYSKQFLDAGKDPEKLTALLGEMQIFKNYLKGLIKRVNGYEADIRGTRGENLESSMDSELAGRIIANNFADIINEFLGIQNKKN